MNLDMSAKKEVRDFIKSQKSIRFYAKVKNALMDVFLSMPDKDFKKVTRNLVIVCLHEGALGQVMHFPQSNGKFKILQLIFPKKIPLEVLRFVLAHELGHVMQGRNWRNSDGIKLEEDADKTAGKWGFEKTKKIADWMKKYAARFGEKF